MCWLILYTPFPVLTPFIYINPYAIYIHDS